MLSNLNKISGFKLIQTADTRGVVVVVVEKKEKEVEKEG